MAARPGIRSGSGGLLVAGDRGVPAPVDEDGDQRCTDDGGQAEAGGPQPRQTRMQRPCWGVARVRLDEGVDSEDHQHHELDREQHVLNPRRDLDAPVADVGHDHDPDHAGDRAPEDAVGQTVRTHQAIAVRAGDLGEIRHHDDVRRDDAPAAEPACLRPECPRCPGERRPAVRFGLVELGVGNGDEIHRDEREQHDRRCLDPDDAVTVRHDDDVAEAGGQAVCGSGRCDADDHARKQTESSLLQPFLTGPGTKGCHAGRLRRNAGWDARRCRDHLFPQRIDAASVASGAYDFGIRRVEG